MEDKINKLKKAFGSKEGIVVLKTLFIVVFFATTIEFLITDSTQDYFVPAFALFTILASVLFFEKKKDEQRWDSGDYTTEI